jgi:hypothetical protein
MQLTVSEWLLKQIPETHQCTLPTSWLPVALLLPATASRIPASQQAYWPKAIKKSSNDKSY